MEEGEEQTEQEISTQDLASIGVEPRKVDEIPEAVEQADEEIEEAEESEDNPEYTPPEETGEKLDLKKILLEAYPSGELDDLIAIDKGINRHIDKDYDVVGAATGYEGEGKSTLVNELCILGDRNGFSLSGEKNCLYSPTASKLISQIEGLPRYSFINADEAVKMLHKYEWQRTVFITKVYTLCRQENKVSFFCLPRIQDFVPSFRNHRIRYWIHVQTRGIAVVFTKDTSAFCSDPWHLDESEKQIAKMRGKRHSVSQESSKDLVGMYSRLPVYAKTFTFPEMPPTIAAEYKKYKSAFKYADLGDQKSPVSKRAEKYRRRLGLFAKAITQRGILNQTQIAKMIGIKQQEVSDWIREFDADEKDK